MALTVEQFWNSTARDLEAYIEVKRAHDRGQLMLWAQTWAILYNAHFRGPKHPEAWTAAELLGEAKPEHVRKTVNGIPVMSKEEMRFNMAAGGMLPDSEVPEWAKATVAASKAAGAVAKPS